MSQSIADSSPPTEPSRWSDPATQALAALIILAGFAVHATMILEAKPLASANDRSRWCTVWSLLERHTYRIDEIRQVAGWDTIDLVYDDGHFYSTKPPILATWVAGVVWCVEQLTGWRLLKETQAVTSVTLLIANGVPLLISWILLSRMLQQSMQSAWGQGLLLIVAVFGTLITPFAVTLNNHSVAAAGAMATIYSLWNILRNDKRCWGSFALCGFASGWTCAHELPAALLGIATFLICGFRDVRKTLIAYLPAAAIPLGFFLLTNWLATGSFKPAYADYGTEKYRFVMEGVPSYWLEPKGIDRNLDSPPVYIFHCLVGHHGLFSLTPVWLLLIPAWVGLVLVPHESWGTKTITANVRALRIISLLSFLLTVAVLAFYFSRTENYNYGGVSCGLRWALWLTPFWLVSLIPLVDSWADLRSFRWIVVPLFLVSAFSAWSRIDNPWRQPWIFTWMESRKLIDYSEPRPALPHRTWTWIATIPDCSDGKPRWMEFVKTSAPQGSCRLRVEASPSRSDDANRTRITATRTCANATEEAVCDVEIDRASFAIGEKPALFVHWPQSEITPEKQQQDLAFLRGLPMAINFRPGVVRYRKTLLRTDAFRCQHALTQVDIPTSSGDRKWRYRCDVWLCEELPFGVAEVELQVHDALTGQQLHQERWQAAACEPPPLPHAQWSPAP